MHKVIFYLKVHHLHLGRSMLMMTLALSRMLQCLSLPTFFSDKTRCPAPTSMIFFTSGQQLFLRIRIPPLQARMRCMMPSMTWILEGWHGNVSQWSITVRLNMVMWPHGSTNPLRSGIVILGRSCTTNWETENMQMKLTLLQRMCMIRMVSNIIHILCLEIGHGDNQYMN